MLSFKQHVDYIFYFSKLCIAFKGHFTPWLGLSYYIMGERALVFFPLFFHRFLNAFCILAFLLFLYCVLNRSAGCTFVSVITAAILLSLSYLMGRINGFVLGQNWWAIMAHMVLHFFSMCSFTGPFLVFFI